MRLFALSCTIPLGYQGFQQTKGWRQVECYFVQVVCSYVCILPIVVRFFLLEGFLTSDCYVKTHPKSSRKTFKAISVMFYAKDSPFS